MVKYLFYFLTGGVIVTLTTFLAESGNPILAGIVGMFPSASLVTLYLAGKSAGGEIVSQTAKSYLISAFLAWIPYLLVIIYLAPKIGVNKALLIGVAVFLILAIGFFHLNKKFGII